MTMEMAEKRESWTAGGKPMRKILPQQFFPAGRERDSWRKITGSRHTAAR